MTRLLLKWPLNWWAAMKLPWFLNSLSFANCNSGKETILWLCNFELGTINRWSTETYLCKDFSFLLLLKRVVRNHEFHLSVPTSMKRNWLQHFLLECQRLFRFVSSKKANGIRYHSKFPSLKKSIYKNWIGLIGTGE